MNISQNLNETLRAAEHAMSTTVLDCKLPLAVEQEMLAAIWKIRKVMSDLQIPAIADD